MAYAITEYEFWSNPKIRRLGTSTSMLLYIAGNGFCNQFLTDGVILHADLETLSYNTKIKNLQKDIAILIESGLWLETEDGYQVNDYLDYYKTKDEVEDLRSVRSESGKKGGRPTKSESKTKANEKQIAFENESKMKANEKQDGYQIESKTKPYNNNNNNNNILTTGGGNENASKNSEVFKAYESEIGALTGMVRDSMVAALEDYPADWIIASIREAAANNKRNWKYCEAILKRWKVDGFQADTRSKAKPKTKIMIDPDGNEIEVAI